MNELVNFVQELFGLGPSTEEPAPLDPCSAAECVDAKERLADEREKYNRICLYLKILKSLTDFLSPIIATPIWVIVILIAIAVYFGGPIAVIIWALIGVYVLSWILITFVLPRIGLILGEALAIQQTQVMEAIRAVIANCPAHCRGDVSLPECRLE